MNKKNILIITALATISMFLYFRFFNTKNADLQNHVTTLIVGTNSDYAPFSFIENGAIVGFDIDIIKEVSKRLGLQLILKDMAFDVLLLELQRGSIQVIAAGLSATPSRAEKVFFTTPYLQEKPLLAITKPDYPYSITSFADLIGKKVLVNEGYIADIQLSLYPEITIERVETVAQCILALSQNKAEVYVVGQAAYKPYTETHFAEKFKEQEIIGTEENCALAVSKTNSQLFMRIEKTIEKMLNDGTIENLKSKWIKS